jgi:photosystem II stability/assembly factor-like uncharacterized protein
MGVYFTDFNTGYIVGTNGIMLKTVDAGETWIELQSGTTQDLWSVCFVSSDIGFAVGATRKVLE